MSLRDFPNPFGELTLRFVKLKAELPAIVSNIAVNDFKENFRRQGYRADGGGVVRWKKRSSGKASTRGILTKSGRLRRSLRPAPRPGEARVVTNVPYAQMHNEGFEGTVQVRAHKRYQWKHSKVAGKGKTKTGKQRMKRVSTRTGVSRVKAHSRKVKLKARPFMVTTKPLLHEIDKRIELEIKKLPL